jgi:hypothetical protein
MCTWCKRLIAPMLSSELSEPRRATACPLQIACNVALCNAGCKTGLSFSLNYAAPETLRARASGRRAVDAHFAADVWALGLLAYELVRGERAFPVTTGARLPSPCELTVYHAFLGALVSRVVAIIWALGLRARAWQARMLPVAAGSWLPAAFGLITVAIAVASSALRCNCCGGAGSIDALRCSLAIARIADAAVTADTFVSCGCMHQIICHVQQLVRLCAAVQVLMWCELRSWAIRHSPGRSPTAGSCARSSALCCSASRAIPWTGRLLQTF